MRDFEAYMTEKGYKYKVNVPSRRDSNCAASFSNQHPQLVRPALFQPISAPPNLDEPHHRMRRHTNRW